MARPPFSLSVAGSPALVFVGLSSLLACADPGELAGTERSLDTEARVSRRPVSLGVWLADTKEQAEGAEHAELDVWLRLDAGIWSVRVALHVRGLSGDTWSSVFRA